MTTQVSAYISNETKTIFENYSKSSGLKKGYIIEQALLQYINAQSELPSDIIIPASVTVSRDVFENQIISDKEPTERLKRLMNET